MSKDHTDEIMDLKLFYLDKIVELIGREGTPSLQLLVSSMKSHVSTKRVLLAVKDLEETITHVAEQRAALDKLLEFATENHELDATYLQKLRSSGKVLTDSQAEVVSSLAKKWGVDIEGS